MAAERVNLDRKEFELFLIENKELVARAEKLVARVDELEQQQRQLREELKAAKKREEIAGADLNVTDRQVQEAIRSARHTMARLVAETEKRISR